MGFFQNKCFECKSKEEVKMCPFCRKDVCSKCLNLLVLKNKTSDWFVGKKVRNFEEYKTLNLEYCKQFRAKNVSIHCCAEYLTDAWAGIIEQIKKFEKDTHKHAETITLK